MRKLIVLLIVSCNLALAPAAAAEETAPRKERPKASYRLDYGIFEVENGKRINERSYSATAIEGAFFNLRAGSRIPVSMGEKGIVYMDVGLKIRGKVSEREEGEITLDSEIEMSNLATGDAAKEGHTGTPIVRNVSQEVSTRLAPGRPTIISSVDDVASRKRLQVEVTLTRVK